MISVHKRNAQIAKFAHCSSRKWKNYKNWYERFIKDCCEPVSEDSDITEEMYFKEANAKCYGLPENFVCLNFK